MMSDNTAPLADLMNAMVTRLDYTHPEELAELPEEKHWKLISAYATIDPVLASLYKQYLEAKNNLGKLLLNGGAQDPMTEVAWDMHDSLRSAVETRLLELKSDESASGRVRALQANKTATHLAQKTRRAARTPTQTLQDMMAFMMLAGMALQTTGPAPHHAIRRDFARAS